MHDEKGVRLHGRVPYDKKTTIEDTIPPMIARNLKVPSGMHGKENYNSHYLPLNKKHIRKIREVKLLGALAYIRTSF